MTEDNFLAWELEEAAKRLAQAERDDNDPVLQAKLAAKRAAEEDRLVRQIAEEIKQGLRDLDGEMIETDEDDEEDDE